MSNNFRFEDPGKVNARLYKFGLSGSHFMMAIIGNLFVSVVLALALGQFLYMFFFFPLMLWLIRLFTKKYEDRMKETGEDDPIERAFNEGKSIGIFRDEFNKLM